MREISFSEAIREAIIEEMERDESVFIMGEDIGVYGGAFKVTQGLLDKFGAERVRNTPISEGGFMGTAIGASLLGMRPIIEIMFMDFIILAMDQLVNQAAKFRYTYGPQASVPIVVRTPGGGGRSYGPTHSQSLEALFMHVPGIKIAAPSNAHDAKGLLKTAIRDDNPVLFVESKALYPQKSQTPEEEYLIPFGEAKVAAEGDDISIIAYSRMVPEALLASDKLAEQDIFAEVIDLRTLNPLDIETVLESAKKTGRVILVEEGTKTAGVCAEVGFQIFENVYDYLSAPIKRITTPDIPTPCSAKLEQAVLPKASDIVNAAVKLVEEY